MPLLAADIFAYQFYRAEKPQNDRSPGIDTTTGGAEKGNPRNAQRVMK
jgi:hypothetical protein